MNRRAVAKGASTLLLTLGILGLSACEIPGQATPPTTVAERKVEQLTRGDGQAFCNAFGQAGRIAAAARGAGVGDSVISAKNEILSSAAMVGPLLLLAESAPVESAGGVERWTTRNNRALGALRQAGADTTIEANLAQKVGDLALGTSGIGSIVDPTTVGLNDDRLTATATSFLRAEGPFDRVAPEINQQLGGQFSSRARESALREFPCLAALDTT